MTKPGGHPASEGRRLAPSREALWVALVFVAACALAWVRIPAGSQGVLWAEDGDTFLREQLELGSIQALFHPYAGYQHFLPRILSVVAAELVPLERFGVVVSLLSLLVAALVCAGTFRLARGIVTWLPARVGVALTPLLVPLVSREVLGDLANLHTYCLWLVVWIFLSRTDTSRWERALWAVVTLACFLTEVQALVALPVLLVRLFWDRSRGTLLILGAALVGAAGQLATWMLNPRPEYNAPHGPISLADIVVGWAATTVLPMWSGDTARNAELLGDHGIAILMLAVVPFALAVAAVLAFGRTADRVALPVLLVVAAAAFGGSMLVNSLTIFQYAGFSGDGWATAQLGNRYGAAAGIFALASFPFAASVIVERWGRRAPRASRVVASAVLLGVGAVVALQWGAVPTDRLAAEPWEAQYRDAVAACSAEPAGERTFAVAPGKSFALACEHLLRSAGK